MTCLVHLNCNLRLIFIHICNKLILLDVCLCMSSCLSADLDCVYTPAKVTLVGSCWCYKSVSWCCAIFFHLYESRYTTQISWMAIFQLFLFSHSEQVCSANNTTFFSLIYLGLIITPPEQFFIVSRTQVDHKTQ